MKNEHINMDAPRIQGAITELRALIAKQHPHATFEVAPGEDPDGIYLTATVDVEDTTEVMGLVVDRLIDLQVEEELPVYVVVVQPLERVLAELRRPRGTRWPAHELGALLPPVAP